MKTKTDITIRDIRMVSQSREDAKREAMKYMLAGDLKSYFKKLLEITEMDEFVHAIAA